QVPEPSAVVPPSTAPVARPVALPASSVPPLPTPSQPAPSPHAVAGLANSLERRGDAPTPEGGSRRLLTPPLLRKAAMAAAVMAALAAVGVVTWAALRPAPGANPEKRAKTRCKEEEVVKKWVIDHAADPASVEFDTWGPHDLQGELGLTWPRPLAAQLQE